MMLADNKLNIPKYCYHDPTITNNYNNTVAMLIAK